MKKITIIMVLAMLFTFSCSKDFDTMNVDPSQFNNSSPEAALQGAFKRMIDFVGTNNTNRWWDVANLMNISGRYNVEDGGLWQNVYVNVLSPIRQVRKQYDTIPAYNNRVQIARIWECYAYYVLVANFGPVPRKQALSDQLSSIMYDPEDSVYTYILTTLKDAAARINVNNTQDRLTYDAIYGGTATSLVNWKKFANTLRLKIALHCSINLPVLSKQMVTEVMADEANTISAESETAKLSYENVINNENPYFIRYSRNSYTSDPLAMNDIMFIYFRSYKDPRLDAYFDSVPVVSNRFLLRDTLASTADDSLRIVDYRIPHLGKVKSPAKLPGWTGLVGNDPLAGSSLNSYSRPKGYGWGTNNQAQGSPPTGLFAPDRPFIILSFADAQFMKAEAAALGLGGAKSAEQYYYEGIDANCAFWKISSALRDAYKARDGIRWASAGIGFNDYVSIVRADIPPDPLTKIYVQQWINYYPDQAFDAWCLQRRTRAVNMTPNTNPSSGVINTPYIDLPLRGMYPTSAVTLNPAGYWNGLAQLGAQQNDLNPYIALKFVKPYTVPNWNAAPAAYSAAFMQKWYGTTIQSLQAAGVAYTVSQTYKP